MNHRRDSAGAQCTSGATLLMLVLAALELGACHRAKSPEAASRDITAAEQSARREVARAENQADRDINNDTYRVALAQADGARKIAIQHCDLLAGNDQVACKKQADADYEAAKADARAAIKGSP